MHELIHLLVFLGGLAAAAAVGVMCGLGLLVWLGGGDQLPANEAWRETDEP